MHQQTMARQRHEYQYGKLPSRRHMRLLWVLPESNRREGLHCSLEVVDIDNLPSFECLSYTWKDPYGSYILRNPYGLCESPPMFEKGGRFIMCDGQSFEISENLLQCLTFLRKRGINVREAHGLASPFARPIWIDAICMNQNDRAGEKPNQIAMMGDIYSYAEQVVVWLGPIDDYCSRAVSVMDQLAAVTGEISGLEYAYLEDFEDPCPRLGIAPSFGQEDWLSYAMFLRRGWFNRVWVAQEVYLAKSLVVFAGEREIKWRNLVQSARVLQTTGLAQALERMVDTYNRGYPSSVVNSSPQSVDSVDPTSPLKASLNNQLILTIFGGQGANEPFSLDRLLSYARHLDVSKAHEKDKFYGLRGIWQQTSLGKKIDRLQSEEYNSCIAVIYMKATMHAIHETKDLNILRLIDQPSSPTLGLPSWVPDYTCFPHVYTITVPRNRYVKAEIQAGGMNWREKIWVLSDGRPEAAHGGWLADGLQGRQAWSPPTLDEELGCLTVQGVFVESIAETGPSYTKADSSRGLYLLINQLIKYPSSPAPYGTDFSRAWMKTVIADRYQDSPADFEAVKAFRDFIAVKVNELEGEYRYSVQENLSNDLKWLLEETRAVIENFSTRGLNRGIIPTWKEAQELIKISNIEDLGNEEKQQMDSRVDSIRKSFDNAYTGRRIFRTEGNYWGLTCEYVEEHDKVFVLAGADTPYVLRESGQGWRVIGEAYVHGLMHGEAVRDEKFRNVKLV
ncbi:heterokaryon incompatibility protein-domain-containing protein [Xylaria arbuscula]|nr:heterokaryon incompatibility protein-domain-containing protein [Xylaria arbuscula]